MALFSRKKKRDTAPRPNPFVTDRGPVAPEPPPVPVDPIPDQPEVLTPRPAGRPEATYPRSKRVSMSLTEAEHAAWKTAAGDQPLSTWAREKVRVQVEADEEGPEGPQGSVAAEIRRLRGDLARVGSNLNQLARGMNQGHIVATDELTHVLSEVSSQLASLRKALP